MAVCAAVRFAERVWLAAGPGRGGFRLGPFGVNVPSDRAYEPGTNTLVTSWKTSTGWAVVREALTMGPRLGEDTITPHTRPPADEDAEHVLVRTVECLEGWVEIELVCEPGFDYGRVPGEWSLTEDRHRADSTGAGQTIRLQTDMLIGIEAHHARARHVLQAGEQLYCALSWDQGLAAPATVEEASAQLVATRRFWRNWLARARVPDHKLGPLIQRSALTIKGLTYMPTGATVAALTTSLPETPGGERNWDYRYTWMRDSTFTLQALHYLNLDWEANEFMQFIADLERNDDGGLQIMYGIDGRRDLTETVLMSCPATPVRLRSGSATELSTSVRTTCSALRLTRSCCTRGAASVCRDGCGRSSNRRQNAPQPCGANPIRASGRRAASRSNTSRRS